MTTAFFRREPRVRPAPFTAKVRHGKRHVIGTRALMFLSHVESADPPDKACLIIEDGPGGNLHTGIYAVGDRLAPLLSDYILVDISPKDLGYKRNSLACILEKVE